MIAYREQDILEVEADYYLVDMNCFHSPHSNLSKLICNKYDDYYMHIIDNIRGDWRLLGKANKFNTSDGKSIITIYPIYDENWGATIDYCLLEECILNASKLIADKSTIITDKLLNRFNNYNWSRIKRIIDAQLCNRNIILSLDKNEKINTINYRGIKPK